ncbi:hypothetical protein ACHAW6_015718 [Cyclotella cf. meneghiniana]
MEPQILDEACTNESLAAASDVAVGGSVTLAAAPLGSDVIATNGPDPATSNNIIAVQPRKHAHFRKRALSNEAGTIESSTSPLANLPSSGISIANDSLNPTMNASASGLGIGAENSIVSFGLNFNFDSTSSPSNSDSGEKEKREGKGPRKVSAGVGCGEREKKGVEERVHGANGSQRSPPKACNGRGSHNKKEKSKRVQSDGPILPTSNDNNNAEENCAESASESGQDQDYNSGGSAASGSGNDGSSGGKSTISSLTTSSNQEWMATSESKEVKNGMGGEGNVTNNTVREGNGENDRNLMALKKDGLASSGKKRKKASKSSQGKGSEGNGAVNDEDSTGGYNTDEEQWGVKINNKSAVGVGPSIVHKQHHVVTTTLGNSDPSSLTESNSANSGKEGGPPLKQARFSIDQHQHPRAVPSVETSAHMALSSLSSDTPMRAVTSAHGRIPIQSTATAALLTSSSNNPSTLTAPTSASPQNVRSKRGASGKHHSATLDPRKREERNAREKERSCRIAKQIDDLRALLSRGGVIVAKGTKSSVLAEAANYINLLQQQQVQWEMDRQSLLRQMQEIGVGASAGQSDQTQMGMQMDLDNNMTRQQHQQFSTAAPPNPLVQPVNSFTSIEPKDYKFIFDNSSLGMAIASMGGAFVDCNENFCKLSEYSKEEVCSMTIFNMTSRNDLQHAFDLISQMIAPTLEVPDQDKSKSIILQGAMRNRNDLGLSISLIKGDHGIGKCFCVTLVRILSMDKSRPDVVSVEMELPVIPAKNNVKDIGFGTSPTYTAG